MNENNYWVIVKDVIIFNCFGCFDLLWTSNSLFTNVYLFIWLQRVLAVAYRTFLVMWDLFAVAHGSLVVAGGLQWDLVAAWHVGPWFPRQDSTHVLHYPANLKPLDHQGSPSKQSCAESNTGISYYFRWRNRRIVTYPKSHLGTGRKNNLGLCFLLLAEASQPL